MSKYLEDVYMGVKKAIEAGDYDYILEDGLDEYDLEQALYDELFLDDSVTGNASGSYFFNAFKSREMVLNNAEDVLEALEAFGYSGEALNSYIKTSEKIEEYISGYVMELTSTELEYEINQLEVEEDREWCLMLLDDLNNISISFETIDVITRCYYLSEALNDYLREEGLI